MGGHLGRRRLAGQAKIAGADRRTETAMPAAVSLCEQERLSAHHCPEADLSLGDAVVALFTSASGYVSTMTFTFPFAA
jgi:hypothetical protein